jgi:hypothetical protein
MTKYCTFEILLVGYLRSSMTKFLFTDSISPISTSSLVCTDSFIKSIQPVAEGRVGVMS